MTDEIRALPREARLAAFFAATEDADLPDGAYLAMLYEFGLEPEDLVDSEDD
jgi:hypothetical protein